MGEEMLVFENVTVAYGEHKALDNFTQTIQKGEFVALIGPNGSGKTTLINALLGEVDISGGEVFVKGKNVKQFKRKELARIVAVVPQHFSTSFGFLVKDIVLFGRHPYLGRMESESAKDYEIADEAMRQTGVLHLKERKITELSGGERQRVVIASALAQQPEILVLDEPTNHLDIHHNLDIMEIVGSLNRDKGVTVLAVLHDINSAARYANRIVLMKQGAIVASGSVNEVVTESIIGNTYNIDLIVRYNRFTESEEIVPIRRRRQTQSENEGKKIHVICGGGSGQFLLEELRNKGYTVSCGVVNVGDSDCEVASSLGIQTVMELPYMGISEKNYEKNLELMRLADAIVLTDVAIGNGNLRNIEALSLFEDKPIIIIRNPQRDFTGGKCDELLNKIEQYPKTELADVGETEYLLSQMLASPSEMPPDTP